MLHIECSKPRRSRARGLLFMRITAMHSAADVVAKAQTVLTKPELLGAIFDVGYFLPTTPPG